ncbi:hypothetical protein QYE76_039097 [Lolium multiflorum]|uniref:Uncharacterized protein n=1 Tax=Lolium multiflorum TaxID=4521 RepID=A0AAD8T913_LOLMU|nr:hypothetical protein QYE76_039097 [Lolium multiflorum]
MEKHVIDGSMASGKPNSGWMDTINGQEQQLGQERPDLALQRAHGRVHVRHRHAQRPGGRHRDDGPRRLREHPRAPDTGLCECAAYPEEMETRDLVVRCEENAAVEHLDAVRTLGGQINSYN